MSGIQTFEHLAALAAIPALVWTMFGRDLARVLWFPLLFIFMATPISDALVPALMVITADIATALLTLTGIPFDRNGQYITLPGGVFVVADVCSGVRYLIAGAILALLFGHLTFAGWRKTALLVLITSLVLILTNGLRAFIVMAVASATDLQYLGGRDHVYFGWLLFGLVMMLILWFASSYADATAPSATARQSETSNSPARHPLFTIGTLCVLMLAVTMRPLRAELGGATLLLVAIASVILLVLLLATGVGDRRKPGASETGASHGRLLTQLPVWVAAFAILIVVPRLVAAIDEAPRVTTAGVTAVPPINCKRLGPWQRPWRPSFANAAVTHAGEYDCESGAVSFFFAAYITTVQGAELVSSGNAVLPARWEPEVSYSGPPRDVIDPTLTGILEVVRSGTAEPTLVWYWYDVNGQRTSSPLQAKLWQVKAALNQQPSGGSIHVLVTSARDGETAARARLGEAIGPLVAQE